MKITVTDSIKIANLEVEHNELVEDVKALVEIEVLPISFSSAYPSAGRSYTMTANSSETNNGSTNWESRSTQCCSFR